MEVEQLRELDTNSSTLALSPLRMILGELLFIPYNVKKNFTFLPLREEQASKLFFKKCGWLTFTSYYAISSVLRGSRKFQIIQQWLGAHSTLWSEWELPCILVSPLRRESELYSGSNKMAFLCVPHRDPRPCSGLQRGHYGYNDSVIILSLSVGFRDKSVMKDLL